MSMGEKWRGVECWGRDVEMEMVDSREGLINLNGVKKDPWVIKLCCDSNRLVPIYNWTNLSH